MAPIEPALGDHNGIRVLTADIPVAFTGSLVFGVGHRDETPRTAGLAHLVEHLVMRRIGRVSIAHNATTSFDNVSFFAKGPADKVADFLNRVAESIALLGDSDDAAIDAELAAIASELGEDWESTDLGPVIVRFGTFGPGLTELGQPALGSTTMDDVRDFARRWLHAGNAILVFTGDVPSGLSVTLPAGSAPARPAAPAPIHTLFPSWSRSGYAPVTVSMFVDAPLDAIVALRAVLDFALMDALRRDSALVYSVDSISLRIEGDRHLLLFMIDPPDDNLEKAAVIALQTIRAIGRDGVEAELVEHTADVVRNESALPDATETWLDLIAVDLVRSEQPLTFERFDRIPELVQSESIRTRVSHALESIHVTLRRMTLDEETIDGLDLPLLVGHAIIGDGKSTRELFKELMKPGVEMLSPRMGRGLRGSQLIIQPDRFGLLSNDYSIDLPLADIVLAGKSPDGTWDFTLANGNGILVDPSDWRGGEKHFPAVIAKLDPAIVYDRRT